MKNSREELKSSAGEIAALEAIIKSNKSALATAREQAQAAEQALRGFDNLSGQIAKWRASQIKRKLSPGRLPQALRDKQTAKIFAQEELELANETAELLEAELRSDEQRIAGLKRATLPAAANAVFSEIIAPLAVEAMQLSKRQHELRAMLSAWSNLTVWGPDGERIHLGGQGGVASALNEFHGPEFISSADPGAVQGARFKALVDALIANPEAQIAAPALVVPADFF